jgi:hypothetical protein
LALLRLGFAVPGNLAAPAVGGVRRPPDPRRRVQGLSRLRVGGLRVVSTLHLPGREAAPPGPASARDSTVLQRIVIYFTRPG